MADVEKDFKELLRLFNKHKVHYCIVGAFAVGYHSIPRYTKDLDIWVEPHLENGERIVKALKEFGFGSLNITAADFARKGRIIQLGFEPVRIDLITSIQGVDFSEAWKGRNRGSFGSERVYYIGLRELVKNKKASGRRRDLDDLETLQKVNKKPRK